MALTQVKAGGLTADLIDETKLADNSIDSEHYNDVSIDHDHLANDAVDGDNIADNSVTLAHMAGGTDGQIITYDASGDPVAVGPGTDGQVLTSTGAGSPPAFEDLPTSGATLSGSTNNQVVTVTGANAMTGEAGLTFDGTHLSVTDGDVVIATAGHGIDFSADGDSTNASGTATGHLLHDFEEGTFDPEYRTGVTSYNTRSGHYTKVGRVVHYQIYVNATLDSTSSTSYAIVKGLPFICDSNTNISSSGCIGWWYDLGEDVTHGYVGGNSTEVVLLGENHNGSRDHVSHNDVFQSRSSARICISGSYITTS